ncbi:hypothetical protein TNCV_3521181 [Trichonephila clavipes]|nr:hypothetical protein TNCV_3521181 [Trichonephila clavipes]
MEPLRMVKDIETKSCTAAIDDNSILIDDNARSYRAIHLDRYLLDQLLIRCIVKIYRPFGSFTELNRTVTCMVLKAKANDRPLRQNIHYIYTVVPRLTRFSNLVDSSIFPIIEAQAGSMPEPDELILR